MPITIFQIQVTGSGFHIELNSANEMSFDLVNINDTNQALVDICAIAPVLMRLDADYAEYFDDAGRTKPKPGDLSALNVFVDKYRSRIKNPMVAIPGFPEP